MTQRERMIAMVAGGVLGVGVLYSLVLDPLLTRLDDADRLLNANTADYDAAMSLLDRQARDTRAWKTIAGSNIAADSSSAESQLRNRLGDAANRAGLKVDLRKGTAEKEKGFDRVQLGVSTTGTLAHISRYLQALHSSDIPLRIVDLNITARNPGTDDLALTMNVVTLVKPTSRNTQTAMLTEGRQ